MRRLPEWVLDQSLEVLVLCLIVTLDPELHPDIGVRSSFSILLLKPCIFHLLLLVENLDIQRWEASE